MLVSLSSYIFGSYSYFQNVETVNGYSFIACIWLRNHLFVKSKHTSTPADVLCTLYFLYAKCKVYCIIFQKLKTRHRHVCYKIANKGTCKSHISFSQGRIDMSKDALLSDICIGTSATPTYLPPHYFETQDSLGSLRSFNLVDGGVAANNPVSPKHSLHICEHECNDMCIYLYLHLHVFHQNNLDIFSFNFRHCWLLVMSPWRCPRETQTFTLLNRWTTVSSWSSP